MFRRADEFLRGSQKFARTEKRRRMRKIKQRYEFATTGKIRPKIIKKNTPRRRKEQKKTHSFDKIKTSKQRRAARKKNRQTIE